jgi:hypothetical protein
MDKITKGRLDKYYNITKEAIEKAKLSKSKFNDEIKKDFLNMIESYYKDAKYFEDKGNLINAFAALNYAHGWLDAGARIGVFVVKDSRLFTV